MDLVVYFPQDWGDWAAAVQILGFILLIGALVYAKGQMNEAQRARKLQAVRELITEIGSDRVRKCRSWVLDEMPGPDTLELDKLSSEDRAKAHDVAVAYDRVGYMVKQHLIPETALLEWQKDEISQLWPKLKPIVVDVQTVKKRPGYCQQFKYLATEWLPQFTPESQ